MNILVYTVSLSLFDSLSTTLQIVVFILLLTTLHPLRNALWYLAGLSGAYFACGAGGFLVLDQLRAFIAKFFPSTAGLSGPLYYQSELVGGFIMIAIGFWYYRVKRNKGPSRTQNMIIAKLRSMNAMVAVGIGALISITSFPASIPYLLALGKYATLHLAFPVAVWYIVIYNIGYALPMLAILYVYVMASRKADIAHDTLHQKANLLNLHLTTWAFAGVGIFFMIDAAWFFIFGHALVKGRFF